MQTLSGPQIWPLKQSTSAWQRLSSSSSSSSFFESDEHAGAAHNTTTPKTRSSERPSRSAILELLHQSVLRERQDYHDWRATAFGPR
jgi:hypothetical protein